jgi:IS30 family transposase
VGLGTRLSDEERARIAELAATRLPSRLIAKEVGRSHRAVWSYVHRLRQASPVERRRSPLRLSLTEREEISRGVAGGESFRAIAGRLGRAPSTISRQVAVNGGRRRYRACRADSDALARARRPQAAKLATCERLGAVVEAKLDKRWSPPQIAGWLPTAFVGATEMRVSHETIHLSLYVQTRGALRKELTRYLRPRHEMAAHARFSVPTGVPVYFCDPPSPWQRGSNENTNGLLRQYFPKPSDLAPFSQHDLDAVAAELNGRPRQTLGWMTPSQTLDQALR